MKGLKIRPAVAGDYEAIMAVHPSSVQLAADFYRDEQIRDWMEGGTEERFKEILEAMELYVAELAGEVFAYGSVDLKECELTTLYVAGRLAGRGIGTALMELLLSTARAAGLERLTLRSSLNAVTFYERHGFVKEKETTHRLKTGMEMECVVMVKMMS